MESKKNRQQVDADFKRQAISMVAEGGEAAVQLSEGISKGWCAVGFGKQKSYSKSVLRGNGNTKVLLEDVHNLFKEKAPLRRQRNIQKSFGDLLPEPFRM